MALSSILVPTAELIDGSPDATLTAAVRAVEDCGVVVCESSAVNAPGGYLLQLAWPSLGVDVSVLSAVGCALESAVRP